MLKSIQTQRLAYLQALGVDVWVLHHKTAQSAATKKTKQDKLDILADQAALCRRCSLHTNRTRSVFGAGDRHADWLIVGEAPGAEEDKQGKPFVGRAGQLLNSMLFAVGLDRQQVYIANILKCRPPRNRDPKPEEVSACASYLTTQIELIQPKIILALGRIAAQNLLQSDIPIGKMRGQVYRYMNYDIPVIATYHPAYLLRSPGQKQKTWEDLKMAMRLYKKRA